MTKKLQANTYSSKIYYERTQKATRQKSIFSSAGGLSLFKENDPLLLKVVASSSSVFKSSKVPLTLCDKSFSSTWWRQKSLSGTELGGHATQEMGRKAFFSL